MKTEVKFIENSSQSNNVKIEGLGICTLNLFEIPFEIAKNSFSAKTIFKACEIVRVKFLTLYENGKKYHTSIGDTFKLTALNDTKIEKENIEFIGERKVHTTEFEFNVKKIKSQLFAYQSMSNAEADAFDAFVE